MATSINTNLSAVLVEVVGERAFERAQREAKINKDKARKERKHHGSKRSNRLVRERDMRVFLDCED